MANSNWERVVQEKRSQQARAIADIRAKLGAEFDNAGPVDDINDIEIFTSKISNGELSSEEVTKACIARYFNNHK